MIETNPPLYREYAALLRRPGRTYDDGQSEVQNKVVMQECDLPLIDLNGLRSLDEDDRVSCIESIARASSQWGFFQVVNHGISSDLLREMRREQIKLFDAPFEKKATSGLLNKSYRYGNPTATSPKQFSWSEAFHVPLTKISEETCYGEFSSIREVMEKFALSMSRLAKLLIGILAERLGHHKGAFDEICDESTCFLRLNHYPACPVSPEMMGLMPHTDSDFLTILYQDQVGGLQLKNNSKWVAVKPNPHALIVNIGDLLQAWSNNEYKSVEHRVLANAEVDRYSVAYFLCPSYDSLIGSCSEPSVYRKFTFGEYRKQIQEDVRKLGQKIGLPRFII